MTRTAAHAISWVFNPGCLIIGLLGIGVWTAALTRSGLMGWIFAITLMTILGLIVLLITWARGVVLDSDLTNPVNLEDRSHILIIFASFISLMLIISFQTDQMQPIHAILVTLLGLCICVALITRFWKISLHMLGVGTVITAILLIKGVGFWPVSLLIPLVVWARLRLRRHTPLQLLGGLLVGFTITVGVFWVYRLV